MNDNKLIAEFMGYEVKHGKCYSPKYKDGTIAPMQFDISWDWLMPVVNKCYTSNMQHPNDDITQGLIDVDIKATYQAAVEFIKEYNK